MKSEDGHLTKVRQWIFVSSQSHVSQAAFISIFLTSAFFIWQGRIGLDMSDEGFLWYGTQRVLLGEVPMRDFFSYDIGRYYWSALFMWLMHDQGVVVLRAAGSTMQALGLFLALRSLQRAGNRRDFIFILVAAVTISVWMFPRHKYFDITAVLSLIAVFAWLCDGPTLRRHFVAGVVIGIAAVFGRNHGVYGVVGAFLVLGYLQLSKAGPGFFRSGLVLSGGVLLGYAPVLLFILLDQGFAHAMWESVLFQLGTNVSTLPVPVPWPWRVPFGKHTIFGLAYLSVFLWGAVGVLAVLWCQYRNIKVPSLIVACAALALPYAHALSLRADTAHLAQAIYPVLLVLLCWIGLQLPRARWLLLTIVCISSTVIMLHQQPGWSCRPNKNCPSVQVGHDQLMLEPRVAKMVKVLQGLAAQYAPSPTTFLAVPSWSGLYAATGREAPMWDTFALQARDNAFQRREIERIMTHSPKFAIIWDSALDDNDELRYRSTHQLMDAYIKKNFVRMDLPSLESGFQFYMAPSVDK